MKSHTLSMFVCLSSIALGQGNIHYVDADHTSNFTFYDGSAFNPPTDTVENEWRLRSFGNPDLGDAMGTTYESRATHANENAPLLALTISGLDAGSEYQIYAYFWSSTGVENWHTRASIDTSLINDNGTPGDLSDDFLPTQTDVNFSRSGGADMTDAPALRNEVDGIDNLGVVGTEVTGGSAFYTSDYFTTDVEIQEGNRDLYQADLGAIEADASGHIMVYIDDFGTPEPIPTGVTRMFFDGVGYKALDAAPDADNDGLSDAFEIEYGLDPNSDLGEDGASGNPDNDGLTNLEEFLGADGDGLTIGDVTDPRNADTDGDNLTDGDEVNGNNPNSYISNANNADTDSDGLNDDVEVKFDNGSFSNPNLSDTDIDGMDDFFEANGGLDPNDDTPPHGAFDDLDGDNVYNIEEYEGPDGNPLTTNDTSDPNSAHSDSDQLDDETEFFVTYTNPREPDTDFDGLDDHVETGTDAYVDQTDTGTDPLDPDTDDDGLLDGVENPGLPHDPNNPDGQPGTNPLVGNTDGDGLGDGNEVWFGSDPTDMNDTATFLGFDFAPDPSVEVQAGWIDAPLGVGSNGTISATIVAVGADVSLDTRDRPTENTDGTGADISNNAIWRDFVFANGSFATTPGQGLDVTITGLAPNTAYTIQVLGYDQHSFPTRVAHWGEQGSGTTVPLSFSGGADPTDLNSSSVKIPVTSDGLGTVVIEGRVGANASASHNVFINGLLILDPEPVGLAITDIAYNPVDDTVALTWTSETGVLYEIEGTGDLSGGIWTPIESNISGAAGTTTEAGIATAASVYFYRVSEMVTP